jgi:hypothetical protein
MLTLVAALAVQSPGPTLPVGIAPHLAGVSLAVERSLEAGDFNGARAALAKWPHGTLTYEVDGLPPRYSSAPSKAAELVSEASGGNVHFVQGASPTVVFRFVQMPPDGPAEPVWSDGRATLQVPVTDRSGDEANIRSIVWSLAKGMAYAAGLDTTTRRRSLMGPVSYVKSLSDPVFSLREQSLFQQFEEVRQALENAMASKTRLKPALPDLSISSEEVDLGRIVQGDLKPFKLTLKNSGNADAKVEIETTCSCLIATPSFVVAAGQSVELEPTFDSADYRGPLEKHLFVLSNSALAPRKTVVLKADVMPEFYFTAPGAKSVHGGAGNDDISEIEVPDLGPTTIDLVFYGSVEPVALNDVQLGNPTATVNVVPFEGNVQDPIAGSVRRKGSKAIIGLPADWPFGTTWLRIVGVTDSKRKPLAEMTIQIRKGIVVTPQSAYFGDAVVGKQMERIVTLEHASRPFKILGIDASDGLIAKAEPMGDRKYRISITLTPAAPGQISGNLKVRTDSKSQPAITIAIGGSAK